MTDPNPKLVAHLHPELAPRRPSWLDFPAFLLKKNAPLDDESVSRFGEEFANSREPNE